MDQATPPAPPGISLSAGNPPRAGGFLKNGGRKVDWIIPNRARSADEPQQHAELRLPHSRRRRRTHDPRDPARNPRTGGAPGRGSGERQGRLRSHPQRAVRPDPDRREDAGHGRLHADEEPRRSHRRDPGDRHHVVLRHRRGGRLDPPRRVRLHRQAVQHLAGHDLRAPRSRAPPPAVGERAVQEVARGEGRREDDRPDPQEQEARTAGDAARGPAARPARVVRGDPRRDGQRDRIARLRDQAPLPPRAVVRPCCSPSAWAFRPSS